MGRVKPLSIIQRSARDHSPFPQSRRATCLAFPTVDTKDTRGPSISSLLLSLKCGQHFVRVRADPEPIDPSACQLPHPASPTRVARGRLSRGWLEACTAAQAMSSLRYKCLVQIGSLRAMTVSTCRLPEGRVDDGHCLSLSIGSSNSLIDDQKTTFHAI